MGAGRFAFRCEAFGTQWEIETPEPLGRPLRRRILARIDQFDTTYSRFRPDSLVARIAAAPDGGRFTFPEDSVALFDLYDRLHRATRGAVDPLVGPWRAALSEMIRVLKPGGGYLLYADLVLPGWLAALAESIAGGHAGFPTRSALTRLVEGSGAIMVQQARHGLGYEATWRRGGRAEHDTRW